jgi:hypothetical protein
VGSTTTNPGTRARKPQEMQDYGPRWAIAQEMLDRLKPERYIYLGFCAIGGAGILISLGVAAFTNHGFKLAEISMLSGSKGSVPGSIWLLKSRFAQDTHAARRIAR